MLVDNVGASDVPPAPLESLTDERWLHILSTNLMSAVRLDHAFVPGMAERKSGVVIHIGFIWHRLVQTDSRSPTVRRRVRSRSTARGWPGRLLPRACA